MLTLRQGRDVCLCLRAFTAMHSNKGLLDWMHEQLTVSASTCLGVHLLMRTVA
jgi:hypothetical protein